MAITRLPVREYGTAGKVSTVSVHSADLTSANFDAQAVLAIALKDAVDPVCLGGFGDLTIDSVAEADSLTPPGTPLAQRENKWLVSARETAAGFNSVTFTIPCADLTLVGADGEEMTAGATKTALIDAIEAFVLSNDGVAVAVESIKFRSRTL